MSGYFTTGFGQAWQLIITHDRLLWDAIDNTIEVAAASTAIAAAVGIPLGLLLGLGRFRGRGVALAIANAGLGLPPVLVGIVLALLFFPQSEPFGKFRLIFTLKGVIVAQTVLALPVVVALTASAVGSITPGLLDQARAYDARLYRVWALAAREARIGIIAAIVAAAGTALSEVAAVVLVGGNIEFFDQTLGSLALEQVESGRFVYGFAVGMVLLALILLISAILTTLQYLGRNPPHPPSANGSRDTSPGMTDVLSVSGLHARRGNVEVLHDVGFSVAAGEVVAVLGPNGAGKSTLLAALSGLLPGTGVIRCSGRVATVLQSPALARRSAVANVDLALAWWRVPRSERRPRSLAALETMRAAHLAGRSARTLSGGEQRRVHLARAIAVSPDLLLLDEPFDGLDPQAHETLRDDTAGVLRDAESAVVVVLHDRADAWAIADRIVVLVDGRVHADGPPQAVLEAPPTPETARLLGYDGELARGTGVLLTRAANVHVSADGDLRATVTRVIGVEDGVRLELDTGGGTVWTRYPGNDLAVGAEVRIDICGGAEFATTGRPGDEP